MSEIRKKMDSFPEGTGPKFVMSLLSWIEFEYQQNLLQSSSRDPIDVNLLTLSPEFTPVRQRISNFQMDENAHMSPDQLRHNLIEMRKLLYGDTGLDYVQLEFYEPVPKDLLEYIELVQTGKTKEDLTAWYLSQSARLKRNQTMGKNIVDTFHSRPQASMILALVGEGHLPGITEILVRDYEFRPFAVEALLNP